MQAAVASIPTTRSPAMMAMLAPPAMYAAMVPAMPALPWSARRWINVMMRVLATPQRACVPIRPRPMARLVTMEALAQHRILAKRAPAQAQARWYAPLQINAMTRDPAIRRQALAPTRPRPMARLATMAALVPKQIPAKRAPAQAQARWYVLLQINAMTREPAIRQQALAPTRPRPMAALATMAVLAPNRTPARPAPAQAQARWYAPLQINATM